MTKLYGNELHGSRVLVDIKIKLFDDDLLMAELNELYDKLFPGKAVSRNFAGARVAQNVDVKYYVTIQFAASGAWGGRGSVFAQ